MQTAAPQIRLVIFDWAGTTVDFGSCAPAAAFRKVFEAHGVGVSDEQARRPMGLNKRQHLLAMLGDPTIAEQWKVIHGRPWNAADVDLMYREFVGVQLRAIQEHSELVPHLLDVVARLRQRGVKIGGTTGYFRAAADLVAKSAVIAGFRPDATVCADDVLRGRPAPDMIFRVMNELAIHPPACVVKIGDTVADVQAGRSAECWSVGVCDSSNLVGLSFDEYRNSPDHHRTAHLAHAGKTFRKAGCHAVVQSIADVPDLIERINQRLAAGERP